MSRFPEIQIEPDQKVIRWKSKSEDFELLDLSDEDKKLEIVSFAILLSEKDQHQEDGNPKINFLELLYLLKLCSYENQQSLES